VGHYMGYKEDRQPLRPFIVISIAIALISFAVNPLSRVSRTGWSVVERSEQWSVLTHHC
jgi:hypothetical protein